MSNKRNRYTESFDHLFGVPDATVRQDLSYVLRHLSVFVLDSEGRAKSLEESFALLESCCQQEINRLLDLALCPDVWPIVVEYMGVDPQVLLHHKHPPVIFHPRYGRVECLGGRRTLLCNRTGYARVFRPHRHARFAQSVLAVGHDGKSLTALYCTAATPVFTQQLLHCRLPSPAVDAQGVSYGFVVLDALGQVWAWYLANDDLQLVQLPGRVTKMVSSKNKSCVLDADGAVHVVSLLSLKSQQVDLDGPVLDLVESNGVFVLLDHCGDLVVLRGKGVERRYANFYGVQQIRSNSFAWFAWNEKREVLLDTEVDEIRIAEVERVEADEQSFRFWNTDGELFAFDEKHDFRVVPRGEERKADPVGYKPLEFLPDNHRHRVVAIVGHGVRCLVLFANKVCVVLGPLNPYVVPGRVEQLLPSALVRLESGKYTYPLSPAAPLEMDVACFGATCSGPILQVAVDTRGNSWYTIYKMGWKPGPAGIVSVHPLSSVLILLTGSGGVWYMSYRLCSEVPAADATEADFQSVQAARLRLPAPVERVECQNFMYATLYLQNGNVIFWWPSLSCCWEVQQDQVREAVSIIKPRPPHGCFSFVSLAVDARGRRVCSAELPYQWSRPGADQFQCAHLLATTRLVFALDATKKFVVWVASWEEIQTGGLEVEFQCLEANDETIFGITTDGKLWNYHQESVDAQGVSRLVSVPLKTFVAQDDSGLISTGPWPLNVRAVNHLIA